ncbi:cytidylyltransferase domain-containing protein [Shewanella glacialimarina]|jgi:spore coat polysaccharide biosynthesis protein SpsF|uniref:cytidylyltransferase domain-containing protein n=1 Tax=Shewanella glacialimarina TaxID=2590884 RepID=UPI001CF8151A|nr:glycosyltransferase family protein [Shewanella glacialimarina]UCX05361.1 acylneuraminate cytidylyltransferase [Shewanella glacialimarina]
MRVICITQARMGSSRLPGKVLAPINGRPMLEYHIGRVKQSTLVDIHIIATTTESTDQPIVDYCEANQQPYFCGDEHDVLDRFYHAALTAEATDEDIIIRLTGDCPLICPSLIDEAVKQHRQGDMSQYTHISLAYFPRGFDVEVFSMASLLNAYKEATTQPQREHVTLYLYSKPDAHIVPIETGQLAWGQFRLCVDEQDDLHLVEQLIEHLGNDWLEASPDKICTLLLNNPQLAKINAHVAQRTAH